MAASATQLDVTTAAAQAADMITRVTATTITTTVITTTLLTGGAGRRGLR
jgi:glycine cleavage system pyridoxal-binding protein P